MLKYVPSLKEQSRHLRSGMTEAEQTLWHRLRGKQINGIQFYRQRPIGNFIVDFLASAVQLVIEVDGSQHQEKKTYDDRRTQFLESKGYTVLRFNNLQILLETEATLNEIHRFVHALPSPTITFFRNGKVNP